MFPEMNNFMDYDTLGTWTFLQYMSLIVFVISGQRSQFIVFVWSDGYGDSIINRNLTLRIDSNVTIGNLRINLNTMSVDCVEHGILNIVVRHCALHGVPIGRILLHHWRSYAVSIAFRHQVFHLLGMCHRAVGSIQIMYGKLQ